MHKIIIDVLIMKKGQKECDKDMHANKDGRNSE